jgi:hypothetical protein
VTRLASSRVLIWGLAPAALLLLAAWYHAGVLGRREAGLEREAAALRNGLAREGFSSDAAALRVRLARLHAETDLLRGIVASAHRLGEDELVLEHAARPFQLIEFERERAAIAQGLREGAAAAGVKLDPTAFGVLADNTEGAVQPRRRWAQLALAREAALRAVAAKVATYEALPVPAVREVRPEKNAPVLAEEVLFSVRVTGDSARVQAFVEYLALGRDAGDLRFLIEHLVLRKDGTAAPDQASATVVFAGLLTPAAPDSAPALAP